MPEGRGAGTFGANLMAGFLRGLTKKYERGQKQEREDELLAGKEERYRTRVGEERKYEAGLLDAELFREKRAGEEEREYQDRLTGEKRTYQGELLDRAEQEAIDAATVASDRRMELQKLINAVKGVKTPKPPKEQTDAQRMRDLRTVYADSLQEDQLRGVMRAVRDYGYTTDAAVGFVLGENMADDIIGIEMKDEFLSYRRAPDEKFIQGDDFLLVLSEAGLPGGVPKLDPNKAYSAKEAIQLYASSQRNPIQFFNDRDSWLTLMNVMFTLLDQNYEPPAPKEEKQVKGGRPPIEGDWFTKITKAISGAPTSLAEKGVEKLKPRPPKGSRR